jgi:uncharacterized membrane protein (DUF373 family)
LGLINPDRLIIDGVIGRKQPTTALLRRTPELLDTAMIDYLKKFETGIVYTLIGMMSLVVLVETFELGWIIVRDLISPPVMLLEVNELIGIFGFFLLVLIGLELLESMRVYLVEGVVHVQVVLEVALIAVARKVIIIDIEKYTGMTLLGFAALILGVAVAFHFIMRHIQKMKH